MIDYGVEIKLKSDFLVVKETLERIGVANRRKKIITPSCYIIYQDHKYYIVHFKELLANNGFKKAIDEQDISRRNAIATLLDNWGLVEMKDDDLYQITLKENIFVLPYAEKKDYTINHKYQL